MKIEILTKREQIYQGIGLWNQKYPEYKIRNRLVEQNIFAPYNNVINIAFGVYEGDKLQGFSLIKYLTKPISKSSGRELAWISLLVGSSEKVLILLLDEIEDKLLSYGVEKIRFGGDPQAFLPGLPIDLDTKMSELLKERGYIFRNNDFDLYQNIKVFTIPERVEKLRNRPELEARPVKLEEELLLLDFLSEYFPGRWLYEAENIRRIPGGASDYWLLYEEGEPVAFARSNTAHSVYQGTNVNWGHRFGDNYCGLGPIGVASSKRGNGYGLLLMCEIIADFQQKGYSQMIIDWTSLVDYYRKLGFSPIVKYEMLFKDLKEE